MEIGSLSAKSLCMDDADPCRRVAHFLAVSAVSSSYEVSILLGHVVGKINESVGVAPLIIIPGDDLDESGRELDTSILVEAGGKRAGNEILGDDGLIGVTKNTIKIGLGGGLHLGADLLVGGILLQSSGKVDDGNVGGGDSEGHTSEFAVELGDDFADSLGSTGG